MLCALGRVTRTYRFGARGPQTVRRFVHISSGDELELFTVTTKRWLYNDEKQRALRHVPFNIQAFIDVAVRAAGAKTCTSFQKLQDGSLNRTFSLSFDNDVEFIAKVPFPVAGPKHFCTASEVATLDYLRTEHGVPVPKVQAWCSKADSSPVGVEYIMYEKLPGVPLSDYDENELPIEKDPYVDILRIIQRIECRLVEMFFSQIGSIYYKEDVPEALRDRPLYSNRKASENASRFCIGPTVNREFWRAGRAALDIDRGPWSDVYSYLYALGACARASVDANPDPETSEDYYRLISDYEKLVPNLPPTNCTFMLWHPDLHASNIIVSEKTEPCIFSGIIDWQGAVVGPTYDQLEEPPAYTAKGHPLVIIEDDGRPELHPQAEELPDEHKKRVLLAYRHAWRRYLHRHYIREADEALAGGWFEPTGVGLQRYVASPATAITRGLNEGLALIRATFARTRRMWGPVVGFDENGLPVKPFPLEMSDEDADRFEEEWKKKEEHIVALGQLLEKLGLQADGEGIVSVGKYERAKQEMDEFKQSCLDTATSPEERENFERLWPFRDGVISLTAESCH